MTTRIFALPFGLLDGFKDTLMSFAIDLITQITHSMISLVHTLCSFIQSMPLASTTQNHIVMESGRIMTVTADALLGLFIVIGTIQILYGETTRSLEMPLFAVLNVCSAILSGSRIPANHQPVRLARFNCPIS